jgi:hypothetical protein
MHRVGAFQPAYFDFCLRRAAQKAFILSDCSLRAAALIGARFRRLAAGFATAGACAAAPGGRPRRLTDPCNASIARLSRSRSATKSSTICSVCITEILTLRLGHGKGSNRDIFMPQFRMLIYESFHYGHALLILDHLDHHPLRPERIFRSHKRPVLADHHSWNLV